jgi:ribosomal protein S18 acetylase RimI-like enzyme
MTGAVQTATLADGAAIVALWQACELTRPWNDAAADFRQAIDGATSDVLFLSGEGEPVATIMVGFDGHRGWVYYLGVSPQHRQDGLGRMMMQAAEDWLRERDAPKIQFMVRDDNDAALGFYQALGYAKQPVVTMGRRLDQQE